jgi:transcriptional regulator with XRE-family HTH domain
MKLSFRTVKNIGRRIEELLKEKGIPKNKFAEMLGTTKQSVNDWTTAGGFPKIEMIVKISDLLEVSIDYLLGKGNRDSNESIHVINKNEFENQNISIEQEEIIHLREKVDLLVKQTQNQEYIIKLLKGEIELPKKLPKKVLAQINRIS